jgi:hypothetical protein
MSALIPGTVADIWSYVSPAAVTDTATDEVKAAKTGYRHNVGSVQVACNHASTGTQVNVFSGSTLLWTAMVPAVVAAAPGSPYVAAVFNPPLMGGIGEAINVSNTTNSSSTFYNVQGFTTKAS